MSGVSKTLATSETAVSGFAPNRADLISPHQLARELGMSLRTLQRHHDARTGPPRITLGKHVFYRRTSVDAWLARREGYGNGAGTTRKPVSPSPAYRTRNARRNAA